MFCAQCGRQIPDGSRFCNFCGAAVTPVSGNPDQVRTETVPGPKTGTDTGLHGFETLPYNKHGYDRETGNAQHTQVPRGGFVQQGYGQQTAVGQSGQWQQNTYGQNSWQQPPQDQPWQQGFTVRTSGHRKKWLLPVIIGAAVLLLGLAAVLLFCCGESDGKASGLGNDPALQANMSNQGVCCQIGEDYYISVPDSGIYRAKRGHMEWTIQETPECVVKSQDKGNGYELFRYLVPVGNRVYYQAVWSDGEWDRFAYRVYDTVQNRDYELFTVDGDHYFCFTLNLIDDRLYYCVEGVLYYIDTTVSPEQGEACRKQTAIRIDEDADIMSCAEGFLVPEEGTLGLKLISPDNQTIRTYQNLKDMVVYVYMIRDKGLEMRALYLSFWLLSLKRMP